jgi:hypothetical protein
MLRIAHCLDSRLTDGEVGLSRGVSALLPLGIFVLLIAVGADKEKS